MAEKLLLCAAVCFTAIVPAAATDLSYTMQSPNFGGTNGTSLQAAQYAQSLRQQQAQQRAAAAAALTSASNNTPAQQFANSLVSQLQSLVARNVALQIAGSSPGAAGTISANGVSITYVNQDGVLNVTIAAPSGTTTFSLPTGG